MLDASGADDEETGRRGEPSKVINIASVDGVRATQTFGSTAAFAYTTSKGAVVHLTKALTRALAEYNVCVNAVCPGMFPSNMTNFMLPLEKELSKRNPMRRFGRTADMAGAIFFLSSPAGSHVSGHAIVCDGGRFFLGAPLFA